VPGGLYAFAETSATKPSMMVNGVPVEYTIADGYAMIEREWKEGDKVEYHLPMEIRKLIARPELKQNKERMALQRGPIVYCVEGADNNGKAWNILAPSSSAFQTEKFNVLDEEVISIVGELPVVQVNGDGTSISTQKTKVRAIPYYTWCNRGSNPMQVWLPTSVKDIKLNY
jgi:DUF1680 family protein